MFQLGNILNVAAPVYIDILSKLLPIHDKNLSLQSEPPSQLPRSREKPKHVQGFFLYENLKVEMKRTFIKVKYIILIDTVNDILVKSYVSLEFLRSEKQFNWKEF